MFKIRQIANKVSLAAAPAMMLLAVATPAKADVYNGGSHYGVTTIQCFADKHQPYYNIDIQGDWYFQLGARIDAYR